MNQSYFVIEFPRLSDESVVQMDDFLGKLANAFKYQYRHQLQLHDHSMEQSLYHQDSTDLDDPPF